MVRLEKKEGWKFFRWSARSLSHIDLWFRRKLILIFYIFVFLLSEKIYDHLSTCSSFPNILSIFFLWFFHYQKFWSYKAQNLDNSWFSKYKHFGMRINFPLLSTNIGIWIRHAGTGKNHAWELFFFTFQTFLLCSYKK